MDRDDCEPQSNDREPQYDTMTAMTTATVILNHAATWILIPNYKEN